MKRKIMFMISMILTLTIICSTMAFAATTVPNLGESLITGTNKTMVESILGTISWIGIVAAIGILIWFGVKYMMASASEKGDMKGKLVYYIMGAIFVAGAPFLVQLIVNLANQLKTT